MKTQDPVKHKITYKEEIQRMENEGGPIMPIPTPKPTLFQSLQNALKRILNALRNLFKPSPPAPPPENPEVKQMPTILPPPI